MVNKHIDEPKKSNKKWWVLLLVLGLLLFLLSLLHHCSGKKFPWQTTGLRPNSSAWRDSVHRADSLHRIEQDRSHKKSLQEIEDSLRQADSLATLIAGKNALSEGEKKKRMEQALRRRYIQDSLVLLNKEQYAKLSAFKKAYDDSLKAYNDSVKAHVDSVTKAMDSRCRDTIAPWVYPEPAGGSYAKPINVSFVSSETVKVFLKNGTTNTFSEYQGSLPLSKDTILIYYALDSCGNRSDTLSRRYSFGPPQGGGVTPEGMVLLKNSAGSYLIDQYEWPNKKGKKVATSISFAAAQDSCFLLKKRLCTAKEWTSACEGPYRWTYPYGNSYEQFTCVTQETTKMKSGDASGCRSWDPIYDMSGNVAEWTSTPAAANNRFYVVKGGFWESGMSATCQSERYSYFPNNGHNPVGFRCCKDVEDIQ